MPSKKYSKEWYQANKDKCREKLRQRRIAKAKFVLSLKAGKTCKHCPENHPACLEFHHRDMKEKLCSICYMVERGFADQAILDEVAKCDLVCANCHRKIHYNAGVWTRTL